MKMQVRFRFLKDREYQGKVYYSLHCDDEYDGLSYVMSVDDAKHITEIFKTFEYGQQITLTVRLVEVKGEQRNTYRLVCCDVQAD